MAWRGPNERPVIQEVYARADTFSGHLSELSLLLQIGKEVLPQQTPELVLSRSG